MSGIQTRIWKMNRIYKSIFNEQTGTYVAVSENTKNKGKKGNKVLAATALSAALGFGAMGSAHPSSTVCI